MNILGYTITKTPGYSMAEIHQFREDLETDIKRLHDARQAGLTGEIEQLENIVHVAREVLLRHLESM